MSGIPPVPESVRRILEACRAAGGRALLVGGYVRDALLGAPDKDVDIEVHGLPLDDLVAALRPLGKLNEVGRSFGVLKLRLHRPGTLGDHEIDVSLPRRDSREGPGHRGIRAAADPHLGLVEAARRRDLTINAIAFDGLTGEFVDPFDGQSDLAAGVLRAVDPMTFGEDPLRALRVAQFAARFEFTVDPALAELCVEMPLHELPAERIRGEVEKLLLRAARPSVGWDVALRTGAWAKVLPEWEACPPNLDRCAGEAVAPPARRFALMLAAACEGLDGAAAERVLDRLRVHRVGGYAVRKQVLFLVTSRAAVEAKSVDDTTCRRLAEVGEVELLAHLVGRPDVGARARLLGIATAALPPLLGGRDLSGLGVTAGPQMGSLLADLREAQLTGEVGTVEEARAWMRARMEDAGPP